MSGTDDRTYITSKYIQIWKVVLLTIALIAVTQFFFIILEDQLEGKNNYVWVDMLLLVYMATGVLCQVFCLYRVSDSTFVQSEKLGHEHSTTHRMVGIYVFGVGTLFSIFLRLLVYYHVYGLKIVPCEIKGRSENPANETVQAAIKNGTSSNSTHTKPVVLFDGVCLLDSVVDVVRFLFTSLQLYFIQTFRKATSTRSICLQLTLYFTLVTNIDIWIRHLLREMHFFERDEYNSTIDQLARKALHMEEIMIPFTLEYSLLAGGLLFTISSQTLKGDQMRDDGQMQDIGQMQDDIQMQDIGQMRDDIQMQDIGQMRDEGQMQDIGQMREEGQAQDIGQMRDEGQMQDIGQMRDEGQMQDIGQMRDEGQMQDIGQMRDEGQMQDIGQMRAGQMQDICQMRDDGEPSPPEVHFNSSTTHEVTGIDARGDISMGASNISAPEEQLDSLQHGDDAGTALQGHLNDHQGHHAVPGSCIGLIQTATRCWPGLIFGTLCGLLLLVSSLMFNDKQNKFNRRSHNFFLVYEGILALGQAYAICLILKKLENIRSQECAKTSLLRITPQLVLLAIGYLGTVIFHCAIIYSVVAVLIHSSENEETAVISIIQLLILLISQSVQLILLAYYPELAGSQHYPPTSDQKVSAQNIRSLTLFLLTTNMGFWALDSFIEMKDNAISSYPSGKKALGYDWTYIASICYPFAIFYRFQSAEMLYELWSTLGEKINQDICE